MTEQNSRLLHSQAINRLMSRHMSYVGKRADKILVVGLGEMHEGTVTKEVERYTMTCDECGGVGYYDRQGDAICNGCGMVLNSNPTVMATEFSGDQGDGSGLGYTRGVSEMDDTTVGHEPSVS